MEASNKFPQKYTPIPHPPKNFLFGNIFQLNANEPTQSTMKLADKYGDIVELFFFGNLSVVVISSFELVKEACDESRFDKNLSKPLLEVRDFAGDGLFTAWTKEPNWHKAHNILLPGLGQRAMKGYFPMMLDIAERLLAKWHNIPEGREFNLTDDMTRLTLDTIGLCGFDYRFNSFASEEPHPFVDAMLNSLEDAMNRMMLLNIQRTLRFGKNRKYRKSVAFMNQIVDEIIQERKANPEKYKSKADLMSLMLNATDKSSGEKLDDVNIRYQILTFLIAGHETTSGLLSFAFYYLMKNPEFLEKAYLEVDTVLGTDLSKKPTYSEVMDLQYIQQILFESLRLFPTAPGFAMYPREDTVLGGKYFLKKYQPMIVLLPQMHRDKRVWGENADKFNPDNFTPEAIAERDPDAFKPFGNGQRACIGRQFAMLEATLVIGMVLQRYKLHLTKNYQFKVKETLTLKPDNLMVSLEWRKDSEKTFVQKNKVTQESNQAVNASQHHTPLLALFGSNMGASEDLALRIAQDAVAWGFDVKTANLDEYTANLSKTGLNIIISSTYNGTPPDNAKQFDTWLKGDLPKDELENVKYTVFGCGNTQWRTFQDFPRFMDARLEELGATRVYPRGEADASLDFDEDFETWYKDFWQKVMKTLRLEDFEKKAEKSYLQIAFLENQPTNPLNLQDYFPQYQDFELVENSELQSQNSPRSTKHITLLLPEKAIYQSGDHLAVLPENSQDLIERICRRFQLKSQQLIKITQQSNLKAFLPVYQIISIEDLLKYFLELQEPITRNQVQTLAEITVCPPEKMKLKELADNSEKFKQAIADKKLSLLDVLEIFQACEISFAQFIDLLNPLKPRYFSISSSQSTITRTCSLTVGVIAEKSLSGEGTFKGICTNYLADAPKRKIIKATIHKNNNGFYLPENTEIPLILIGAGTGFAPFRGFLEERDFQKKQGKTIAKSLLFFGCRHPEQDFIYQNEIIDWEKADVLEVITAFSRLENEKCYVQHQILKNQDKVWELMQQGAKIYVCGDAVGMASEVKKAFMGIYQTQNPTQNAEIWLSNLIAHKMYLEDIWAS